MLATLSMLLVLTQVPVPSSADEETVLALSAAPEALRDEAGVYVHGPDGFTQKRPSHNGVNCLVERGARGSLEPICWDAEGSATLLPVALEKARLRAKGTPEPAVESELAASYASGRFRPPRRAGVAYMLSIENHVWNGEHIVRYLPHIMVYAPYVTNADIGSSRSDPWMPWVLNEGKPNAYIVTVVRTQPPAP